MTAETPLMARRLALAQLATGGAALAFCPFAAVAAPILPVSCAESVPPPETGRMGAEASPDAELLAACAEFDVLSRAHDALDGDDDAQYAEQGRISDQQDDLAVRITACRATTMAGHVARARSLVGWAPDLIRPGPGTADGVLLHGLLRDLLVTAASTP